MNPQDNKYNPFAPKEDKDKPENKHGFLTAQPSPNQLPYNMPNSANPFGDQNKYTQNTMFNSTTNANANTSQFGNTTNTSFNNQKEAFGQSGQFSGNNTPGGQNMQGQGVFGQTQTPFGQTQNNMMGQNNLMGQPMGQNNALGQPMGQNTVQQFGQTQGQPLGQISPFGSTQGNNYGQQGQMLNNNNTAIQNKAPLFGSQSTSFAGQPTTPFGGPPKAPLFGQSTPFGNQNTNLHSTQQSNNPFSAQPSNSNPFNTQSSNPTPFGAQTSNPTPFGTQPSNPTPFGTQLSNPTAFGAQPNITTPFGAQPANSTPFGSQPTNSQPSPMFGQQQSSMPFGAQPLINQPANNQPANTQSTGLFGSQPNNSYNQPTALFGGQQSTAQAYNTQQNSAPLFGQQNTSSAFTPTASTPFNAQPSTTPFGALKANTSLVNAQPSGIQQSSTQSSMPFNSQPPQTAGPFGNSSIGSMQQPFNQQQPQTQQTNPMFGTAENKQNPFATESKPDFGSTQPPTGYTTNQAATTISNAVDTNQFESKPQFGGYVPPATQTTYPAPEANNPTQTGSNNFTLNAPSLSATNYAELTTAQNPFPASDIQKNNESTLCQSQSTFIKSNIPLDFRNKCLNEIVCDLSKQLEDNVAMFKKKAMEVYEVDEKMIHSRNVYCQIIKQLDEQEKSLNDYVDNIDYFNNYIEDLKKQPRNSGGAGNLLGCVKEVEKLVDDYNAMVAGLKDEDDEIMCLINENVSIIQCIEKDLSEIEGEK